MSKGARYKPGLVGMIVAASLGALAGGSAFAQYVGPSYVNIPSLVPVTKTGDRANWLRLEAYYWKSPAQRRAFAGFRRSAELRYPAPTGPQEGAGELAGSIDKRSPLLRKVMVSCAKKTVFPDLTFAIDAERNVPLGMPLMVRPSSVPRFYEYRMKDVRISECPSVADAPEQAVVFSFSNIEWLNYRGDPRGPLVTLEAAELRPLLASGATKTFVVSWFAVGNFVDDKQCKAFNKPPSEDQYYELLPKAEADKERAERSGKGGVSYQDGTMELRGPNRLNAVMLPGIVRDPGQLEPKLPIALGLDLDGDDGNGRPPAGVCRHQNFTSPDGRSGIDNQLYRVQGCATGYQGRRGFLMQYGNEQRRNGTRQLLVHITGIDDERNDDAVDITFIYSNDPLAKSADGAHALSDYTYRLSTTPELAMYQTTLRGRIVEGNIVASSGDLLRITDPSGLAVLHRPSLRLTVQADGSLKGVVGGYVDWRKALMVSQASSREYNHGLQIPAWYNAMRRYADGLKNPVTGQCDGISTAYELDASPAFLPPEQNGKLLASKSR